MRKPLPSHCSQSSDHSQSWSKEDETSENIQSPILNAQFSISNVYIDARSRSLGAGKASTVNKEALTSAN
ncbi:MAG: hypothetical protein N2235_10455 [Fischerella sp.]|nr:hypothetical protein [Fischerella sp.]